MTKLLLASVFKPYGVDDEYGEVLCSMELLNNQVTREQGIHSPRSNNPTFGLYILAENVKVPTTVLDFPSWDDFKKEIKKGYSHVGLSFIMPNVLRAKRMAAYIREVSPETKILLGGHGTSIPNLDEIVDYDEICRGEGVAWLRQYFGEDASVPITHPVVLSAVKKRIYGAPVIDLSGTLVPGVGCQNSCRFCATSHKFERRYTPFLTNGKDFYEACERAERELGVNDFGVLDENYLKTPRRASQVLAELEKHEKAYTFAVFSSAETIVKMGVDFLVRMGVTLLWIGVESKWDVFEKTRGIDLASLIREIQDHGISVLASSILFLEHHDKTTIHEDIDWAIDLESDLHQFMLFGPIPGTKLYQDYEAEDKLLKDMPWPEQHGQDQIWFNHPEFTGAETATYIKEAFLKKYHAQGPGVLNMAATAIKGYLRVLKETEEREQAGLVWDLEALNYVKHPNPQPDEYMKLRLESLRKNAIRFRPILSSMIKYGPNAKSAEKGKKIIELFDEVFGKLSLGERVKEKVVQACAVVENLRLKRGNGVLNRQPKVYRRTYPDRSDGYQPKTELHDRFADSKPLPVVAPEPASPSPSEPELQLMEKLDQEKLAGVSKG